MIMLFTRFRACASRSRSFSSCSLPRTPISATPTRMQKRTTAGTTFLANESKGLDGMYRLTRSTCSRGSTRLVLKNADDSHSGRQRGAARSAATPIASRTRSTTTARVTRSLPFSSESRPMFAMSEIAM